MSRRTQFVSLFFECLDVEVVKFYICQHKICPECSVFLSPECVNVDGFCRGVAGFKEMAILVRFGGQGVERLFFI